MDLEEKKKEIEWYDNPSIVTSLIVGLIVLIIILSQSFAINNNLTTVEIFRNILNHNSVYLLVLVYFVMLKMRFGKQYFNYLNLFLMLLYFLTTITSLLTVFQSFSLATLLSLAIHGILIVYLVHTFFRDTRVWKDFGLGKSPFNELTNDWYFYSIMLLSVVFLAVNLISTTTFDGTVLALLDCIYAILFARYIYLYRNFLDQKKKKIEASGNFSEYREKVKDTIETVKNKVEDIANEVQLEEKVQAVSDAVGDITRDIAQKVDDLVEDISEEIKEKPKMKTKSSKKKAKSDVREHSDVVKGEK